MFDSNYKNSIFFSIYDSNIIILDKFKFEATAKNQIPPILIQAAHSKIIIKNSQIKYLQDINQGNYYIFTLEMSQLIFLDSIIKFFSLSPNFNYY